MEANKHERLSKATAKGLTEGAAPATRGVVGECFCSSVRERRPSAKLRMGAERYPEACVDPREHVESGIPDVVAMGAGTPRSIQGRTLNIASVDIGSFACVFSTPPLAIAFPYLLSRPTLWFMRLATSLNFEDHRFTLAAGT